MELAIVGLDGLSENMIDHCREELPVLDAIISDGAGGTLWSTTPPVTLPAWTTFWTGKDPGKHGLYNMTSIHPDYEITSAEINETEGALFDALDDSVFINLPATYPREPTGDALLVRGNAPSPEAALPDDIRAWEEADEYRTDYDSDLQTDFRKHVDDLCDVASARFGLTKRAIEEREPRTAFVLFSAPDWLGHSLGSEEDKKWIPELLRDIDDYLEWIQSRADNLLVMSDHGFEIKTTAAYPNEILKNEGLISTRAPDDAGTGARLTVRAIKAMTKHSDLIHEVVRRTYNRFIHTEVAEGLYNAKEEDIDYEHTVAWHDGWGVVYLNDEYFDNPTVSESEYEAVQQQVIDTLAASKHPDTDEPLFRRVRAGQDVYEGESGVLPDVVVEAAPHVMLYQTSMQDKIASPTTVFNHRPAGLFYCVGDAFSESSTEASIVDIAPTIMHLLDEGVPEDMDGTVIRDVLADDRSIEYRESIEPGIVGERSAADDERIQKQLADLGYLE